MVLPHSDGDLYHKYRPRRFNEMSGHKEVIKSLKSAISSEHPSQAFLLTGDSGTGKTSSARITALALNCLNKKDFEPCLECNACKIIMSGTCVDIIEKNAADHRGIDAIRELSSSMSSMPMQISNKIYILDEAHQLTRESQSSLLKVLEDTPRRVFIILCTTNPEKLLPTIKNRCQTFKFKSLSNEDIRKLLEEVCTYEGTSLDNEIIKLVAEASGGSPRNALVRLQQVLQLNSNDIKEISIFLEVEQAGGEDLFKFFSVFNSTSKWPKIVESYNSIKEMGPPAIGMCLAGYFRNKLVSSGSVNFASALELFVDPFEDGKIGENKLILHLFKAYKIFGTSYGSK